jgi:DNA polymerase-3 subunit epsilon
MMRFFHNPKPDVYREYRAGTSRRLWKKQPLKETRVIALDIETSGFSLKSDRILSVALFDITGGRIEMARSRKWIVFQTETVATSATAIHGILPSETREGTAEKQVLEELLPLLTGAILVGHHIRFDALMLNKALLRHFKSGLRNHLIDTASLAMNELTAFHRSGYANQHPPSLEEVCAQLDLPVVARHTAEGDAFLTAEIFLLLSGRIRKRLKNRRFHRREPQLRDLSTSRFRP